MSLRSIFNSAAQAGAPSPANELRNSNADSARLLFDAVDGNNLARVTTLLTDHASVDARNDLGETPLMHAVHRRFPLVAEELLKRKADPNAVTNEQLSPLCYAAQAGNWDMVQLLAENGARISGSNAKEFLLLNALLLRGIEENNPDQCAALKAAGVHDADVLKTKVFGLIEKKDIAGLDHCLAAGVPADLRDAWGNTLFMKAIVTGTTGAFDILAHYGADVSAVNRAGDDAMSLAQKYGQFAAVIFLRARGVSGSAPLTPEEREHALHAAVYNGGAAAVESLLNEGASANGATPDGKPLIQLAVERGHPEIAAQLFNAGANPADVGVPGVFTLGVALVKSGDAAAVKKFLDSGALNKNTGPAAFTKFNLLHVAAEADVSIAKLVIAAYPGLVNRKEDWGSTPLRVALEHNNLPMAQALLDAGSDPRTLGKSPKSEEMTDAAFAQKYCSNALATAVDLSCKKFELIQAASRGDAVALESALGQGVSPNVTDGHGTSLLKHAVASNHIDVVKTLLRHKADVSGTNGVDIVVAAIAAGNPDTVRLLGDAGASVAAQDSRGFVPASYLILGGVNDDMKSAISYCKDLDIVRMSKQATQLDHQVSVSKKIKFRTSPAISA